MALDQAILYIGFISTVYLTYMILSYTVHPASRPIAKEVDKYGDDNRFHIHPIGSENYSENTDADNQKHLKTNGAYYEIDPNQYHHDDYH
jgi:hypothetical protein